MMLEHNDLSSTTCMVFSFNDNAYILVRGGSVGTASDSRSKDRGSNPVCIRSARQTEESFSKSKMLC